MNLSIKPIHFNKDYINCKFFNNKVIKLNYRSPSIFLNGLYLVLVLIVKKLKAVSLSNNFPNVNTIKKLRLL